MLTASESENVCHSPNEQHPACFIILEFDLSRCAFFSSAVESDGGPDFVADNSTILLPTANVSQTK